VSTVLVVDDEASVVELVGAYLEREGYRVLAARDGETALRLAQSERPDVVILDIMLPGLDGIQVLARLRQESDVYVILLTARSEEADKLVGLAVGADDYVTKPFSPREVAARVKAALRRLYPERGTRALSFDHLRIDSAAHRVWLDAREIELTPTEFELLQVLAEHAGQALTREQMLERLWGHDFYGEERVVDVHIGHLRQKLAPYDLIQTVRGVGYRFEDAE